MIAQLKFLAHIYNFHLRQGPVVGPAIQFDALQGVFRPHPGHGAHIGGNGRRGAAQKQHGPRRVRPIAGHLPGVVPGTLVRKIAGFVFLVHHDDPDIPGRREHGGTCADDHPGFPGADAPPFIEAFARGKAGVQHRRLSPKPGMKPAHHLRGQGNFRHQHDGGFAHFQRPAHQTDVHLRLAAAGHAVEQKAAAPVFQRPGQFRHGGLLAGGQFRILSLARAPQSHGRAAHILLIKPHQSLFLKAFQGGGVVRICGGIDITQ